MWTHYSNGYAQVCKLHTSARMQLLYNLGSHDHGSFEFFHQAPSTGTVTTKHVRPLFACILDNA